MYTQRFYRDFRSTIRWQSYRVRVESSDLYIRTQGDHAFAVQQQVIELRSELKEHILRQPVFASSLSPVRHLPGVPAIVNQMYRAAEKAGVGPMAAVAGAVAECVGGKLMEASEEVIVENGGDIYLKLREPGLNTIFAGRSPFSGRIGIRIDPDQTPLGVCTSSGSLGHSFSQGQADAVTILSRHAWLADAVATGAGNLVCSGQDVERSLDYAMSIEGVLGAVVIIGDKLGARGEVELEKT
jgi:hypothetical protein